MKKIFWGTILVGLLAGCTPHIKKTEDTSKKFTIPQSLMGQIEMETVSYEPIVNELHLSGEVSYDQDKVVKIYPMVSGDAFNVKTTLGDYVSRGQILAVVHSSEMAGAQNDLIAARANLAVAQSSLASTKDMYKSGISSEKEYVASQKEVAKAKSELQRVRTVLSIYGAGHQANCVIRSPISGYIVEKNINPGMQIRSDNGTNLFTISDLKTVWVLASVYESDISKIHLHERVFVSTIAYPDRRYEGEIDKIYSVLDPDNKTLKVRIQLSNRDNLLKPQMFANVIVQGKTNRTMLAVPAKSVIFDRDQYWVVVYKDQSNVEARRVDVANSNSEYAYIRAGVSPGEKVLTNMQLLIYNALNQ